MIPRLDEFTHRELNTVLKAVCIQILYLEQAELRGDIKFKTDKKYVELEDLRLFKTQLVNAAYFVKERETTQAN